jgi:penicillin-binding protein 1C
LRSAPRIPTRRQWLRAIAVALAIALGCCILLIGADRLYPLPPIDTNGALVVVADDGTPLRNYPSRDGIWRYPAKLSDVSPYYAQTLMHYEDGWFYWHPGVNPLALARAAWQWMAHGRIVSGGSTLTMQVARLLDPALAGRPSRSMAAKARQAWRALQLEMHYSKGEIPALYLSHAPMGGIVEGAEMGARLWLGKSAADLSRADAALLTALPQAPSRLRPDRQPLAARAARDKVLDRMVEQGVWSAADVADAKIENVVAPPLRSHWLAPLAAQRLKASAPRSAPGASPGVLVSTLNPEFQTVVEHMLQDRVDALPPHVSMAVLVMDNDTMEIKAYAGSADFTDDSRASHVDMVRGVRSPGSTLKPFLYGMALDDGLVHSESLMMDVPMSFHGYAPGNFQATFSGPVSVASALAQSLNVPAVDLLDRVGPVRFASGLMAAGINLRLPAGAEPNLSLILGGGGTTLEQLVGAYRALARGGRSGKPRLMPSDPKIESRVMSEGAAWIVRDILEGGGHPDRPFYQETDGRRRLAWKTGTSFGFRDAWAIGVTDAWTIGVWVGRPDGTPNPGFFGANIAAPLVQDIVSALPAGTAGPRVRPASVSAVTTCWPYGVRKGNAADRGCTSPRSAWALNETVPPTFQGYEPGEQGKLRIVGIAQDSQLRPVPGAQQVVVDVTVQGASSQVWWMLDGNVITSLDSHLSFTVSLSRPGRYTLTVMDKQGRFDRVGFEIYGIAP